MVNLFYVDDIRRTTRNDRRDMYAVVCGHGKPSTSRIFEALKNHIVSGSTLVHDGEKAHDKEYLENMALINNMCSWVKSISIYSLGWEWLIYNPV